MLHLLVVGVAKIESDMGAKGAALLCDGDNVPVGVTQLRRLAHAQVAVLDIWKHEFVAGFGDARWFEQDLRGLSLRPGRHVRVIRPSMLAQTAWCCY